MAKNLNLDSYRFKKRVSGYVNCTLSKYPMILDAITTPLEFSVGPITWHLVSLAPPTKLVATISQRLDPNDVQSFLDCPRDPRIRFSPDVGKDFSLIDLNGSSGLEPDQKKPKNSTRQVTQFFQDSLPVLKHLRCENGLILARLFRYASSLPEISQNSKYHIDFLSNLDKSCLDRMLPLAEFHPNYIYTATGENGPTTVFVSACDPNLSQMYIPVCEKSECRVQILNAYISQLVASGVLKEEACKPNAWYEVSRFALHRGPRKTDQFEPVDRAFIHVPSIVQSYAANISSASSSKQ